ncbi:hypothetical protein ACFPRL_09900 [Pseudoclavibacter helvolus]
MTGPVGMTPFRNWLTAARVWEIRTRQHMLLLRQTALTNPVAKSHWQSRASETWYAPLTSIFHRGPAGCDSSVVAVVGC